MKKIIITICLLLLTGCQSFPLGAEIVSKSEKSKLKVEQAEWKKTHDKYKHVAKYKKGNSEYTITEYVTPNGEAGYQIIEQNSTSIISTGFGPESRDRTYVVESLINTTSITTTIK